ncbi:MAG: hypothetical protein R3C97_07775 [Geminicoccaceae bacterium]
MTGGVFAFAQSDLRDRRSPAGRLGHRLGSLTPWLGLPLFVMIVTRRAILFEEERLAAAFGPEYEAYRTRVRRWL